MPNNAPDPYELADPGYSINNFYTQATADSAGFRFRVSNECLSMMAALVASKDIPEYKTPADVVRDALRHRLKWVDQEYKPNNLRHRLHLDLARDQAEDIKQMMEMRRATSTSLHDAFEVAFRERSRVGCQQVIDHAEALLNDEQDEPFQDDLRNSIERMKKSAAGLW